MSKITRILNAFCSVAWAIQREKLDAIVAFLELRASGVHISDEEIRAMRAAAPRPRPSTPGAVAVIPVFGTISHRANLLSSFSGGTSINGLTKSFRQALNDPNVKAIVFDVDSPGGSVSGVSELADEIYNARGQKKMVAVCNSLMASAAYWIGTAADEVVCTPSGAMGSIGVFMVHEDYSQANEKMGVKPTYISAGKYKVEGNPDEPLTDEARQSMQDDVDKFYSMFVNAIARQRGVSAADVRSGFGQGRCLLAKDALAAKMCDRIATLDATLSRFGAGDQVTRMSSEEDEPEIEASAQAANDMGCDCDCDACMGDDCENCSMEECDDPMCAENGCPMQSEYDNDNDSDEAKSETPQESSIQKPDPKIDIDIRRRRMKILEQS